MANNQPRKSQPASRENTAGIRKLGVQSEMRTPEMGRAKAIPLRISAEEEPEFIARMKQQLFDETVSLALSLLFQGLMELREASTEQKLERERKAVHNKKAE